MMKCHVDLERKLGILGVPELRRLSRGIMISGQRALPIRPVVLECARTN
jgi:hypothetical protein